jgi:hypothetical protein
MFTGAFYYDAAFWTVEIPEVYGLMNSIRLVR